jgi:hypothetical protein
VTIGTLSKIMSIEMRLEFIFGISFEETVIKFTQKYAVMFRIVIN